MADTITQSLLNNLRNDKFVLTITLPPILRSQNSKSVSNTTVNLDKLQFSVISIDLPGQKIEAQTLSYGGSNIKISKNYREAPPNVRVKFMIDNQFANWWVINKWLDELSYHRVLLPNASKTNFSLLPDYCANFELLVLDEFQHPKLRAVYQGAFPTSIGDLVLNQQTDEPLIGDFEFAYNHALIELKTAEPLVK